MVIPNIIIPACQISHPYQVTTFIRNNHLYGILKFDQIMSFIEQFFLIMTLCINRLLCTKFQFSKSILGRVGAIIYSFLDFEFLLFMSCFIILFLKNCLYFVCVGVCVCNKTRYILIHQSSWKTVIEL